MSVALLIHYEALEDTYTPFATESFFFDNWDPFIRSIAAQFSDIEMLLDLESGRTFAASEVPGLLMALELLGNEINASTIDPDIKSFMMDRLGQVRKPLMTFAQDGGVEVFFG